MAVSLKEQEEFLGGLECVSGLLIRFLSHAALLSINVFTALSSLWHFLAFRRFPPKVSILCLFLRYNSSDPPCSGVQSPSLQSFPSGTLPP